MEIHRVGLPLNPFHYERKLRVVMIGGLCGAGKSKLVTSDYHEIRNPGCCYIIGNYLDPRKPD